MRTNYYNKTKQTTINNWWKMSNTVTLWYSLKISHYHQIKQSKTVINNFACWTEHPWSIYAETCEQVTCPCVGYIIKTNMSNNLAQYMLFGLYSWLDPVWGDWEETHFSLYKGKWLRRRNKKEGGAVWRIYLLGRWFAIVGLLLPSKHSTIESVVLH